jgi:3-deoxy-D-manno-octulosonate 8-phosphate phosphatase (KDO 8-P phosphatase)
MKRRITAQLVIFDIDGVFTDGTVLISDEGREFKRISYLDIDGYFKIRRKFIKTAFVTGEETPITAWFKKRFTPDYFISGEKNKDLAIKKIIKSAGLKASQVCYVGDSRHDIPALKEVGWKICPANAVKEVKSICTIILSSLGGNGAIAELADMLGAGDK